MAVYRVSFLGADDEVAQDALTTGALWEGSRFGPDEPSRHRVLIEAGTEHEAIAGVRRALAARGSFREYEASLVTDSHGEAWRRPLSQSWADIDWEEAPRLASLRDLQRAVLSSLADAAEPTWIVAAEVSAVADRDTVEAVLEELENNRLVYSVLEAGGEPGKDREIDRWWAITDETWDLLGLIKSPWYG